MLHGWPGSFFELYKMAALLQVPRAYNGQLYTLDLVIPSLPGYGFSEAPEVAGMSSTAKQTGCVNACQWFFGLSGLQTSFNVAVCFFPRHGSVSHGPYHEQTNGALGLRTLFRLRRGLGSIHRSLCCSYVPGKVGSLAHTVSLPFMIFGSVSSLSHSVLFQSAWARYQLGGYSSLPINGTNTSRQPLSVASAVKYFGNLQAAVQLEWCVQAPCHRIRIHAHVCNKTLHSWYVRGIWNCFLYRINVTIFCESSLLDLLLLQVSELQTRLRD